MSYLIFIVNLLFLCSNLHLAFKFITVKWRSCINLFSGFGFGFGFGLDLSFTAHRGSQFAFCSAASAPKIAAINGAQDRYGLEACESNGDVHLRVNVRKNRDAAQLHEMLTAWQKQATKLKTGTITQEEYDRWRYHYPDLDTSGQWQKVVPSQSLSDILAEALSNDNGR